MLKRLKILIKKSFLIGASCALLTACGGGGGETPGGGAVTTQPTGPVDVDTAQEDQNIATEMSANMKNLSYQELLAFFPKETTAITQENIDQLIENYLQHTGDTLSENQKNLLKQKILGTGTGTLNDIDFGSLRKDYDLKDIEDVDLEKLGNVTIEEAHAYLHSLIPQGKDKDQYL